MKKQNIVLIGFRGAGKTTFGKAVAEISGLPFADLDAEVEYIIGETIEEFVDKHGWQVFREVEQRVAHDFARNFSGILATGGGTIENSKNLQNLKKTGCFVFVNPDFSDVRKYLLSDENKRPQINPDISLVQEIDTMWTQRKDIYAATADLEVNPDYNGELSAEAQKIIDQITPLKMPTVSPKKKIAVLASTKGTSLQGLFDIQKKGRIPNVEFTTFVTNKKDSAALEKAKKSGQFSNIEVLEDSNNMSQEEYDRELINILREEQPDLILLIGWMKILSPLYCEQFGQISLNTHPSLLPKFAGMMSNNIYEKVIEYEEKYTGCTIHRVTQELDAGEMVLQRKVLVDPTDNTDDLKVKVQKQEVLGFAEILERRK